jgi:hypothetical protein
MSGENSNYGTAGGEDELSKNLLDVNVEKETEGRKKSKGNGLLISFLAMVVVGLGNKVHSLVAFCCFLTSY